MNRRSFLLTTAAVALGAPRFALAAPAPLKEVRIGFQKTSALLVVKARRHLEKRFEPQGLSLRWVEFAFGPPLLEALPPARSTTATPATRRRSSPRPPTRRSATSARSPRAATDRRLVPKDSPVRSIADLKGKRVASPRGRAHTTSSSPPPRARASPGPTSSRSISRPPTRRAPSPAAPSTPGRSGTHSSPSPNSSRTPARCRRPERQPAEQLLPCQSAISCAAHADIVTAINAEVASATVWAADHRDETAQLFSEASGVDIAAQKRSVDRAEFAFGP